MSRPLGSDIDPCLSTIETILGLIPYLLFMSENLEDIICKRLCPTTPSVSYTHLTLPTILLV